MAALSVFSGKEKEEGGMKGSKTALRPGFYGKGSSGP